MPDDLNLSIYRCRLASVWQSVTVIFRLQYICGSQHGGHSTPLKHI